jgi:hypothetical protein
LQNVRVSAPGKSASCPSSSLLPLIASSDKASMHHQPLQINCNESQQQFFLDLGPRSDSILHASGSDCNISCEPCVMRHRDGTAKHDDDPDCHVPQRTFAPEARRAPAKLRHHLLASAWHNFTTCFIKLMYRRIRGCTFRCSKFAARPGALQLQTLALRFLEWSAHTECSCSS